MEGQQLAVGYIHVACGADGTLRERAAAIKRHAAALGLEVSSLVHDVDDDGRERRASLVWALEQLAAEHVRAMVVARLHDLSSGLGDLVPLLRWFESEHRRLIAVDLELDTATDAGRLAAKAIAGAADGVSSGRRSCVSDVPELREWILSLREQGRSLQAIADTLNRDGIPTLRGGARWRPSSVQRATGYLRPSSGPRGIVR